MGYKVLVMDSRYVVINNNLFVEHIIDADEKTNKDSSITIKQILENFFPEKTIVKESKKTGRACIGGIYIDKCFTVPPPYSSWIWSNNNWSAPIEYPNDGYAHFWNEDLQKWEKIEQGAFI